MTDTKSTSQVAALRWQSAGHDGTLDSRLDSGRGTSKVHALAVPTEWDGEQSAALSGRALLCGKRTPLDDDWLGAEPMPVSAVSCRGCLAARERSKDEADRLEARARELVSFGNVRGGMTKWRNSRKAAELRLRAAKLRKICETERSDPK